MLSGIATSNTACSGSRNTPIATNTAARTTSPTRSRFPDQRHHHPENDRDQQADRRAGHAGQDAPQRVDLAVTGIERRQDGHDDHRRADQPGKGRDAAGNPAKARAEHHRQVDDVRTGQEMAQREGLVEFLRRHPAVLVDDAAPRPDQHAAEARQRHFGERHEQSRPGWVAAAMWEDPAPGRRPAANPGACSRSRTAASAEANPNSAYSTVLAGRFPAETAVQALFFSTFAPYIEGAGSPAMEINGRRNKPFGPGGSTRRLHPSPPRSTGFGGGETGSTRA